MPVPPPALAEQAILASSSLITRRCDIYEADGITPWAAGGVLSRLMDGAVSIDFGRDERRSVDLTLDNSDGVLRHDPDGFWYDKVLKVYHGVQYYDTTPTPTVFTRTNLCLNPTFDVNTANWLNNWYGAGGTGTNALSPGTGMNGGQAWRKTWTAPGNSADAGFVAVIPVTAGTIYSASAYEKSSVANVGGVAYVMWYDNVGALISSTSNVGTAVFTAGIYTLLKVVNVTAPTGAVTGRFVFTPYTGGTAVMQIGDYLEIDQCLIEQASVIKPYFDGSFIDTGNVDFSWTGTANASASTQAISGSVDTVILKTWETQVGEFLIDRLEENHFPPNVKVTGRDYTKKCLISKFTTATAFASGSSPESIIKSIAQAAGVTKFTLPATGKTTGKDFFFERGVERWAAMKEIANAYGYDIYFDAQGYLTIEEYHDPVYAPLAYTLQTGPVVGNLVSFTKSTNDSRLYNHIVVTGESSDTTVLPVSAEATNTEPSSPSRIARLGDRVYQFTSAFITTETQCQVVANNFLRIHALEEYDLNFASITFPWLEVGEIVEFIDPNAGPTDPIRFLLSSLTIPLGLSPMSGNAKRVSIVG